MWQATNCVYSIPFVFLFILGVMPGSNQNLLLFLCSEITPGDFQGTADVVTWTDTGWLIVRQIPYAPQPHSIFFIYLKLNICEP